MSAKHVYYKYESLYNLELLFTLLFNYSMPSCLYNVVINYVS